MERIHKGIFMVVIVLLIDSYTGVSIYNKPDAYANEAPEISLVESVNEIGFNALSFMRENGKNSAFSPLSLNILIAMLASGASGNTKKQLQNYLFGNANVSDIDNKYNAYIKNLIDPIKISDYDKSKGKIPLLSLANSAWIGKEVSVLPSFTNQLTNNYCADIFIDVDFKSSDIVPRINEWASKKTYGKIPNYLQKINHSNNALSFFSTVYFKDYWYPAEFELIENQKFYLGDKDIVKISMIKNFCSGKYYENEKFKAVKLPLYTSDFVIVLPKKNIDEVDFNLEDYNKIVNNWKDTLMDLKFPEFKINGKYDLTEMIKAFGVTDAFVINKADFTKVSENAGGLYVDLISQQCYFEVNKYGIEGAAVTSAGLSGGIERPTPMVLTIDRPFYFVVTNKKTSSITFIGIVNNPSSE